MSRHFGFYQARIFAVICIYSFVLGCSNVSYSKTLIECSASEGKAYFFENALLNKNKAGWTEDGISKGQMLIVIDGENTDIQFKDATEKFESLKNQNFKIIKLPTNNPNFESILAVSQLGVIEHYLIKKDGNNSELLHYQSRYGDYPISSSKLFRAPCKT